MVVVGILTGSKADLVLLSQRTFGTPASSTRMEDFVYRTALLDVSDLSPRFAEFKEGSVSVFGDKDDMLYVSFQ